MNPATHYYKIIIPEHWQDNLPLEYWKQLNRQRQKLTCRNHTTPVRSFQKEIDNFRFTGFFIIDRLHIENIVEIEKIETRAA